MIVPENIGLDESEVTGFALVHHKHLDKIMLPYVTQTEEQIENNRVDRFSGDAFKAEFMSNTEIPQRVIERIERAVNTFKGTLQPGYLATEENRTALVEWLDSRRTFYQCNDFKRSIS